jgi:serine/threonine protein kinase/Tfp pilus assembly protein PilF
MIGKVISHYRILEKLGEGGMGVVYKAEDTRLRRIIALKFLPPELTRDPEAKERFVHEAQAASALHNNNICVVYDIDESDDGQMFISMEYLEGETLKAKLERGPLAVGEALDITLQIGKALARAHEQGIVHRDIKPANVMLTTDGVAKIVDFGTAKFAGRTMLTKAGNTPGTLAYMSPEQVRGLPVDQRTDIWALGTVLYEMLTGQQPFRGEYDPAVLYAILEVEPEPIGNLRSDVPGTLDGVLALALNKDPTQRYQRVEELVADVQPLAGGSSTPIPTRRRAPARRRSRWPMYAGGAAALCIVAITVLVVTSRSHRGTSVRSLAVLPFRNTSASLDDTVFAEGMTEALSTELSKIRALVVRSSRSAMRFKNSDKLLPEIARDLNVDALIDGSTQLTGKSVRVSVNLINVNPEQQIWGENYKEEMEDINTLQSKVAQAVAREIKVVLTAEDQARLARTKPVNAEAYQACVYGRFYWNKWTRAGFQRSLDYFRIAVSKDPSYAPAYAGIADVYATLWYNGAVPFDSVEPYWRPAAQKALDLDAEMAEGHVSLAATRIVYDWDWSGSEQELKHALILNPGYATGHHWYALLLSALGRHDSAISEVRRARELDPLSVIIVASAGWIHIHARSYDQAIAQFRKALELDSLCAPAHSGLGEIYEMQGKDEEALAEYLRLASVTGGSFATLGGGVADPVSRLRSAYRSSGWQGYWTEQLRQLEGLARTMYVSSFHMASVCARLKRTDDAFRWLQRAYQERSTNLLFVKFDPNMENLRDDPRYGDLVRRIGLTDRP